MFKVDIEILQSVLGNAIESLPIVVVAVNEQVASGLELKKFSIIAELTAFSAGDVTQCQTKQIMDLTFN